MLITRNQQTGSRAQKIAALEDQYIRLLESKIAALTAVPNTSASNDAASPQKVTSQSEVSMTSKQPYPTVRYINQYFQEQTQFDVENEVDSS